MERRIERGIGEAREAFESKRWKMVEEGGKGEEEN